MENRLMQKFSDAMEVQESLANNYAEMKDIMADLESKLSCSKSHPHDIVERSQSVALRTRQNGFSMLPRVHPVTSSKVFFLALKRRAQLKTSLQSLEDTSDKTEPRNQRMTTAIHETSPATLKEHHLHSSVPSDMVGDKVSTGIEPVNQTESVVESSLFGQSPATGVEPVDQAESVVETSPFDQSPAELRPEEDAEARTPPSWLRKLVTIKDSALVLHKDFRAAR